MRAARTGIGETGQDRVFLFVNFVIITIVFLLVLYPLLYVLSNSFSSAEEVLAGRVWLVPVRFSLEGFKAVFEYKDIWVGYGNTIYYTAFGTILNIAMTIAISYPLSRTDFFGRNAVMFLFTFTMFFSGGLIPTLRRYSRSHVSTNIASFRRSVRGTSSTSSCTSGILDCSLRNGGCFLTPSGSTRTSIRSRD